MSVSWRQILECEGRSKQEERRKEEEQRKKEEQRKNEQAAAIDDIDFQIPQFTSEEFSQLPQKQQRVIRFLAWARYMLGLVECKLRQEGDQPELTDRLHISVDTKRILQDAWKEGVKMHEASQPKT